MWLKSIGFYNKEFSKGSPLEIETELFKQFIRITYIIQFKFIPFQAEPYYPLSAQIARMKRNVCNRLFQIHEV